MSQNSENNQNWNPRADWYVIYCKPSQEQIAKDNLLRQGFDVFLPRVKSRKFRRGKWIEVVEVMFSRYLFISLNSSEQSISPVRSTKGVIDLVRFCGRPALISDEIIGELMQYENRYLSAQRIDYPHIDEGEDVKLVVGPLAGMDCVFFKQTGEQRAIVLLEMLGKTNEICVDRDWIAKIA